MTTSVFSQKKDVNNPSIDNYASVCPHPVPRLRTTIVSIDGFAIEAMASYRPTSASRLDSELDAALNYLGFNPLEGVHFELNPHFLSPTDLLRRTEAALAAPVPGEVQLNQGHYHYDGRVERQVIEQVGPVTRVQCQRRRSQSHF